MSDDTTTMMSISCPWMTLLANITREQQLIGVLSGEEETERRSLTIEERSCMAHLVRKFRASLLGRRIVHSDDDEEDPKQDKEPRSSLLMKYKRVAARRQVEWDMFEDKMRALRRTFEETNDASVFDQMDAITKPGLKKKPAATSNQPPTTQPLMASEPEVQQLPTTPRKGAILLPPVTARSTLVIADENMPPISGEVKQLYQQEGFGRSSIIMEERASRLAMTNLITTISIEGDEESRTKDWDRQCYSSELARREGRREAIHAEVRKQQDRDVTDRHRAIVLDQTNRVFYKKMLREKRVLLQHRETQERDALQEEYDKAFHITIVLRNFKSILTIVPIEEASWRGKTMGEEWREFQRFILRLRKYYEHSERLLKEGTGALDDLYDVETFTMRYDLEMFEKTQREQEEELRRRDGLRLVADAEEVERIKLEELYGALPLAFRKSDSRLVVSPADHLAAVMAYHPPSNITNAVRSLSQANQEANRLFMALEPKYVKARKGHGAAELLAAASSTTTSDIEEAAVAPPTSSLPFVYSSNNTPAASSGTEVFSRPIPTVERKRREPPAPLGPVDGTITPPQRSIGVNVVSPKLGDIRAYDPDDTVMSLSPVPA